MSGATAHWLAGRRGIVAGAGEAADTVAAALVAAGAAIERIAGPSTDVSEIAAAFEAAEAKLGAAVDLLVHAGVAMPAVSAERIDLDGWRTSLNADIDGRFLFAAEFARRLIAADGALANLVKSLAVEWGRLGIRTNAIRSRACEPGGLEDEAVKGSLGHLAAYLSSGYGAYITGCLMGIDEL